MTNRPFNTIALIGKANHSGTTETLAVIQDYLLEHHFRVICEARTAEQFPLKPNVTTCAIEDIGAQADLAIVVGGDGNMLGAARVLCEHDIAVIGVNRGNLGFLTELDPTQIIPELGAVLAGEFVSDPRLLLSAAVYRGERLVGAGRAINEVVLHSDKVAHMIEFEVEVNEQFVYSQRSDGLIVATPTGSTAYSLSGGGPIVAPELEALTMVSMFPHTLSSRPIVVPASATINLLTTPTNDYLQLSCDGHVRVDVQPGDRITIRQHSRKLQLIQPNNYSYFNVLRKKLHWGSRLF